MTFHEFLESRHFLATIANKDDSYSPYIAAETKAIKFWIDMQMSFLKFVNIFKVIGVYFSASVGFIEWPKNSKVIIEEYNAKALEQKKQADALKAQDPSLKNVVTIPQQMKPKTV